MKWWRLALVSFAAAVLAGSVVNAHAQAGIFGTGPRGGQKAAMRKTIANRVQGAMAALWPPKVIASLTPLQPAQEASLAQIHKALMVSIRADRGDPSARRTAVQSAGKQALAVLTSDQKKDLQRATPAVMMLNRSHLLPLPRVADANITKVQWASLINIAHTEMESLRGTPRAGRREKLMSAIAAFKTQAQTILTPEQLQAGQRKRHRRQGGGQ